MSLAQCRKCKKMGHYSSGCPENKKNKEIDQVWCNNCKEPGHYVATCPQEQRKELKDINCFNCKNAWHYASNCPERMKNKLNKPMEKLNLGPWIKGRNKTKGCLEKFSRTLRRPLCNFCLKIFKGGSILVVFELACNPSLPKSRDEIYFKGGSLSHPKIFQIL